jgi:hypothetical protein
MATCKPQPGLKPLISVFKDPGTSLSQSRKQRTYKLDIQRETDLVTKRRPMHTSEEDSDCTMDKNSTDVMSRSGASSNRRGGMVKG